MNFSAVVKVAIEKVGDFLFPPMCLCCHEALSDQKKQFCPVCLETLSLINGENRCNSCFQEIEGFCFACRDGGDGAKTRVAAAMENQGAAPTFLKVARKHRDFYKVIASFMALQMIELDYPVPDVVIPFPVGVWPLFFSEYEANFHLAKQLATLFSSSFQDVLTRRSLEIPGIGEEGFVWKKKIDISDQVVLIVSEKLHMGQLKILCDKVHEGFPRKVMAISFVL